MYTALTEYDDFCSEEANSPFEPQVEHRNDTIPNKRFTQTTVIQGETYSLFTYCKEPITHYYKTYYMGSWSTNEVKTIFGRCFLKFVQHPVLVSSLCKQLVCKHDTAKITDSPLRGIVCDKWNIADIRTAQLPYFKFHMNDNYVCFLTERSLNIEEAIPTLSTHVLWINSLKSKNKKEIGEYCRVCYPNIYTQFELEKKRVRKNIILREIIKYEIIKKSFLL